MLELLVLAFAGAIGAFMHAFVTKAQNTWSRETVGSVFLGVLIGLLYPLILSPLIAAAGIELPQAKDPAVAVTLKGAIMAVVTYVGGDTVQNLIPGLLVKIVGKRP